MRDSGRLVKILADLHIHTGLSPCASEEMTPPAIVEAALRKGLAMIAVCDHNTSDNAAAVQAAAKGQLAVLAGMEITTSEEVHVMGLFRDTARAQKAAREVRETLPDTDPAYFSRFGSQPIMNERGEVIGHEKKMLAMASRFNLSQAVKLITAHEGLSVACHVDRKSYSVTSQLGVFPRDVAFDAIEVSPKYRASLPPIAGQTPAARIRFEELGLPMLRSSDSHFLCDIGTSVTEMTIYKPVFDELALALKGRGGRSVRIGGS